MSTGVARIIARSRKRRYVRRTGREGRGAELMVGGDGLGREKKRRKRKKVRKKRLVKT